MSLENVTSADIKRSTWQAAEGSKAASRVWWLMSFHFQKTFVVKTNSSNGLKTPCYFLNRFFFVYFYLVFCKSCRAVIKISSFGYSAGTGE